MFGGVYICVLQFSLFIYCKHEAFNGFFIEFENPEKQTQRVRWGVGHRISRAFKESVRKVWKFQRSTKKEVGFPGVLKKKSSMEYPWLLVFDF